MILDVGHGSAAILDDEGGTVVIDAGSRAHVTEHLISRNIHCIQTMLLSHSDSDHIGGAITLLTNPHFRILEVILNSDPSKNSVAFEQLKIALADSYERTRTIISRRLVCSTNIPRKGSTIEVLHPPDVDALSGVGSKPASGKTRTSNSLSAAIRIFRSSKQSILLAGDIDYYCVESWQNRHVQPTAAVLVFPHHGGLPGTCTASDAAEFAEQLSRLVSPRIVLFSNHRTLHGNPRDEVINAIIKSNTNVRFACTQLPDRFLDAVIRCDHWSLHRSKNPKNINQGSIALEFEQNDITVRFIDGA